MPSPKGYTRLEIMLHWGVAVLILQQYLFKDHIAAAWTATTKGLPADFDLLVLAHVAGGALVLVFALWRQPIKARRGTTALTEGSPVLRAMARVTHQGLYALMILMLVSGAIAWFGGVDLAAQGHNVLKVVLLALVALHVIGALYHHLVLKDGTIDRMRRAEG